MKTKIEIGDYHRLAREVQKDRPVLSRLDDEYYRDCLLTLAKELEKGCALGLSGYVYTPIGGRCWLTSDGGKLIITLSDLLVDYGGPDVLDCVEDGPHMIQQLVSRPATDQREVEG